MFEIIFFLTIFLSSFICFIIDIYYPKLRIKPEINEIVKKEYKKMLPQVLINLSIGSSMLHIIDNYYYEESNNFYFIFNFLLWFILADFSFFFVHINLHRKQLYWLHKKHHEYIYTYGIGAIYSSCFEFIFGNIISLSFPFLFIKMPRMHICWIIIFSTASTVFFSHGGYIKNNKHLQHHKLRTKNFGLGISDRIYGTY